MNKKMNSIKKRLLNACSKLINPLAQIESTQQETTTDFKPKKQIRVTNPRRLAQRRISRKTSSIISKTNDSESTPSVSSISRSETRHKIRNAKSVSSGYGTSIKSTQSVFMNLDNYFYDENFSKSNKSTENTKQVKLDAIQHLLDYQIEFLQIIKSGLENHIRPLSAVMSPKLYFEIFQNIEKIYTTTEFVRNSINESMLLTCDLFTSTITVISEYINTIVSTYEFYLKGYAQSASSISDREFTDLLKVLNKSNFMSGFNLVEFIDLPIKNIAKIYCTFMSLLEMTPNGEEHEFERLNKICQQIKLLIEPSINESFETESTDLKEELLNFNSILENNLFKKKSKSTKQRRNRHRVVKTNYSSPIPNDFTDLDGKKYYFV